MGKAGKKIILEFTPLEAEALLYAVRNSTHDPDFMVDHFPNLSERMAAWRAEGKLVAAIRAAGPRS